MILTSLPPEDCNLIVTGGVSTGLPPLFKSFIFALVSGLKNEKKLTDKTAIEVDKEEDEIRNMRAKISQISKDIEEIKQHLCPSPTDSTTNTNK